VLGLAIGTFIAILLDMLDMLDMLDTKVHSETDIAKVTDTSVIASIGYDDQAAKHPLIVQTNPHSQRCEAFRHLRTNLQFLELADRPKAIVVTSSVPGEGKTTTAINLAITLADAGSAVALVDADLRRPSIADCMGLDGQVGLTTVLIGRATLDDAVQHWGNDALHILPSGLIPPNPSELLGSQPMAELLDALSSRYDFVPFDTPPLLPVTDAAILAKITGGALVVAAAESLHRQQLSAGLGSLKAVGARVLGVVVNRLADKHGGSYSYDYAPRAAKGAKVKGKRKAAPAPKRASAPTPATSRSSPAVGPKQPRQS
jgi:succinoglycan biosynthesis transport protein ExoP